MVEMACAIPCEIEGRGGRYRLQKAAAVSWEPRMESIVIAGKAVSRVMGFVETQRCLGGIL